MSGKISTEWDEDIYGNSLLLVRKNRGKLNLDEVLDAIRYDWRIQGHYVMILNATEATCGVGWDLFGEEKKTNCFCCMSPIRRKHNLSVRWLIRMICYGT